jgi:hypothetical protein
MLFSYFLKFSVINSYVYVNKTGKAIPVTGREGP